jgi:hypothetical protein
MRKLIGVAVLITALTCPAYAGEMQNDKTGGMPSSAPAEIQNGAPGEMPNGVAGDMPNGVAGEMSNDVNATSDIQGAEFAFSLLQSLLSLF